jgi:hypothetical protein
MKTVITYILLLLCCKALAGSGRAETTGFDSDAVGTAPSGWLTTKTGRGESRWTIERDETAPSQPNILKQSGEATYPICLWKQSNLQDGSVEVKFKAVSGKEDQAAGIVWRAKDSENYYVARANALEDNVTIYHTIKGQRTEKKRAKIKVSPGQWHTLRVEIKGIRFVVSLNGKRVLEWEDKTFQDPGMVGLWTKADSVTLFDDFTFSTE